MRRLCIYIPAVVVLAVALALPQYGPNLVGRMNGHQIAVSLAMILMMVAFFVHLAIASSAEPPVPTVEGEAVLPDRSLPLEYASGESQKQTNSISGPVAMVSFLFGAPIAALGLVVLLLGESNAIGVLTLGLLFCGVGMALKAR